MGTPTAQAPPTSVQYTATFIDGLQTCNLYADAGYYFSLWFCDTIYSGIRLVTATASAVDSPLGTKFWRTEFLTATPFLAGSPVILQKTGSVTGVTTATLTMSATYLVTDTISSRYGEAAGTVGWNSTTFAATSITLDGTIVGLYLDPRAYTTDDLYNYEDAYTVFHRALCTQFDVLYDGTSVVSAASPSATLWTHYATQSWGDGAQSHKWSVNFPYPSLRSDRDWGKRTVRQVAVDPFGQACLVQSADWLKGVRLLFSKDRFRSFSEVTPSTLAADAGFHEWAGACWYPHRTGWSAYYLTAKRLWECQVDYAGSIIATATVDGTIDCYQIRGTGTDTGTAELFDFEHLNWQSNLSPHVKRTCLVNTGTVTTVTAVVGEQVSTAYASDYYVQAAHDAFGWKWTGTTRAACGPAPGTVHTSLVEQIANPRYEMRGHFTPSRHAALGIGMHATAVGTDYYVTTPWGSVGTSTWEDTALLLDVVFRIHPGDAYWYGMRDDYIYESTDGEHWTCINRVPDWYLI